VIISVLAELNTIVTDQCATLIVTLLRNFNMAEVRARREGLMGVKNLRKVGVAY
jgi:hypothetical protein